MSRRLLLTAHGLALLLTLAWVFPAFASVAPCFAGKPVIFASQEQQLPGVDLSFCAETAEGNEAERAYGVVVDCGPLQTAPRIIHSAFISAFIQQERHLLIYLAPESRGPPLH